MDIFHSLSGAVDLEITTADPAACLTAITEAGIILRHVRTVDGVTLQISVFRQDCRKIGTMAAHRGWELKILGRKGIYWRMQRMLHRPVLLWGVLVLLLLVLYLPTRVLFVQVEGNIQIPTRLLLEAAENCGIEFGASRRAVRSERMKNSLLQAVPQLQWAGVNTHGCVAVISVRERSMPEQIPESIGVSSMVALRDGIITACTATEGNLLCRPGQAVREGEILISGYTDCGILIRATQAKGEVFARTIREISIISPVSRMTKGESSGNRRCISVILGKKRINLWKDSGICDATCDRIYEEYYVTLPGGFQLPMALAMEEYRIYETEPSRMEESALGDTLARCASDYLREQMIAGTIESQDVSITPEGDVMRLAGKYICTEMIGKVQIEQIGENNGESG